jgi:methionyl-tRNA synthetase
VPVPEPGFEEKRFYVWFDACIGYVSSTMEWAANAGDPDRWREYWQEPDTRLIHFIGKDNTVFHALVWPALLTGAGEDGEEPYVLPYDVPANEFMNLEVVVDGERRAVQMSTSRNLAVWLHEALDRFPADPLRFYLSSNLPETGDVAFSWRDFGTRVNSDLIGNLGNYINRVLSFSEKYAGGEMNRPRSFPKTPGPSWKTSRSWSGATRSGCSPRNRARRWRSFSPWESGPTASSTRRRPGRPARTTRSAPARPSTSAPSCSAPSRTTRPPTSPRPSGG